MPTGQWELLGKNGEVARFSSYVIGAMNKKQNKATKYSDGDLKDDIIREMKFCRKILGKESDFLPPALLKEVLAIVWANKGK